MSKTMRGWGPCCDLPKVSVIMSIYRSMRGEEYGCGMIYAYILTQQNSEVFASLCLAIVKVSRILLDSRYDGEEKTKWTSLLLSSRDGSIILAKIWNIKVSNQNTSSMYLLSLLCTMISIKYLYILPSEIEIHVSRPSIRKLGVCCSPAEFCLTTGCTDTPQT
jgi:hypothetical protein